VAGNFIINYLWRKQFWVEVEKESQIAF